MTILFPVRHDFDRLGSTLRDFARRQPRDAAKALNWTAYNARDALRDAMRRTFDRPNRWTLGGIVVQRAEPPDRLEAAVGLNDRVDIKSRGIPSAVYLRTQIEGGTRDQKSHEKALSRAGIVPPGYFLVPTRYADVDAHGNMTVGQINKILSGLNAFSEVGFSANAWGRRGRGKRRDESYFAIVPGRPQGRDGRGGGLPPGIYKVVPSGLGRIVLPVAVLTGKAPSYTPKLDFDGIMARTIDRDLPRLMGKAMEESLRRARPGPGDRSGAR